MTWWWSRSITGSALWDISNLTAYGEKYASSAHLGMLDIIAALEWVRDNIANFGGDPGNVTIFGQSGGGGKVGNLMAMPAAQGLFHRAIVQSGSFLRAVTPDRSAILTQAMLDELNLSPSQVDQLQTMPLQKVIEAGDAALLKTHPHGPLVWSHVADQLGWGPVMDGKLLPQHPFDPAAPAISARVPMLIGTTLNEFTTSLNHPEYEAMTEAEVEKRLGNMYGNDPERIVQVFRASHPEREALRYLFPGHDRAGAAGRGDSGNAQDGARNARLSLLVYLEDAGSGRPAALHPLLRSALLFRQYRPQREPDRRRPCARGSWQPVSARHGFSSPAVGIPITMGYPTGRPSRQRLVPL